MALPPGSHYDIQGFHVDLSTISEGEAVELPVGWEPLAVAEKNGNDLVLLLFREATM